MRCAAFEVKVVVNGVGKEEKDNQQVVGSSKYIVVHPNLYLLQCRNTCKLGDER